MDIELHSAMLLSSALLGMMSVVLFFLRNSYPSSVRGIGEWALALAMVFVGNALFGFRDQLPDFLTTVAANALVMIGLTTLYFGTQLHFDHPIPIRGWLRFGLVTGAMLIWFSVVTPNYSIRLGLMAAFMASSLMAHSRFILRFGSASFPNRFAALVMAIQAAIIGARSISLFFNDPIQHFHEHSSVQLLYLTSFVFSGVLISLKTLPAHCVVPTVSVVTAARSLSRYCQRQVPNKRSLLLNGFGVPQIWPPMCRGALSASASPRAMSISA